MSRRRDLEHHRHSLGEIREIMNSMKTLAYMETHKLARFLPAQQAVVESIQAVADDFLSFHPAVLPEPGNSTPVYLLIGTERGFCGDFNQQLLRALDAAFALPTPAAPRILAIGHKLEPLLTEDERVAAVIDGASVVEEVPAVLQQVVKELAALQASVGSLSLYGLHHGEDGVGMTKLLPPFQAPKGDSTHHHLPPLLYLPPESFLLDLTDHYLFAALHQMLYASLMAENHRRVAHLEVAVRNLDEHSAELARRCNALRQEEIIEEIEVILLSSASLDDSHPAR
jgi:F-type H+-transporting ATPase subunit gamma